MNIIPQLHSTLISIPKMAEHGYIAVFDKKEAKIYDGTTTLITATADPIIIAPRHTETGLWRMALDQQDQANTGSEATHMLAASGDSAIAIFDLPNSRQTTVACVLSSSRRIPHKTNFPGRGSNRQLRNVARAYNHPHCKTFPRLRRNPKGTHERAAEGD